MEHAPGTRSAEKCSGPPSTARSKADEKKQTEEPKDKSKTSSVKSRSPWDSVGAAGGARVMQR